MRDIFNSASSFNQDLSDWNVSAVTNMIMPLANTPALSGVNKGLIHGTFSKNPNWTYDWSAYHTRPAHAVPSAANLRMLWVQPGTFTFGQFRRMVRMKRSKSPSPKAFIWASTRSPRPNTRQ